ncbi:putative bifunctional diguanylate cyclase/phosphodiesterase [Granulosicoccus antarcticus]|uniref:Putative signaling protein n=1 Tax=Granulosicoccus antarcticus IMCC3135 TaxID=1192854 RepID=A0A2Z2NNI0_9GAMM|nr:bifunctional diguanylate cyclase/phosphodiesterase [Granulosicoccus antarcticus]ASJ72966.1 putative signaling protein [Granulosicoccus antarcticus IMCC3135]
MPDFNPSTDLRIHALAHVQAPLCLFDVDSLRILWANEEGLKYWQADSLDELRTREFKQDMAGLAKTQIRQIHSSCHEDGNTHTGQSSQFFATQLAPVELRFSAFATQDTHKALLIQALDKPAGVEAELLHGATALLHTPAMISVYDAEYDLIYCNPAARDTLSHTCTTLPQRLLNEMDLLIIMEELEVCETCNVELEVNTLIGPRWHQMTFQITDNALTGKPGAILVSASDATERRIAQQSAYKLAYTDSLTGLPNRAALNIYLDELLSDEAGYTPEFSLFFLDLDRFKIINDSLGHAVGDQLLIETAHRLKQSIGTNSLVSRLGGDEFVVITNKMTDIRKLTETADNILQSMAEPVILNKQKLHIKPSIGICRLPMDGANITELMENADAAMYLAKSRQCGYCFFDKQMSINMSENIKDRLGLENDLVTAVKNNEFELYYQPKISCITQAVTGVEALIRWHHPTRGLVPPDDFISIAEDTGQILQLGNWVLDESMRQQREWHKAGLTIPVSINISAHQFNADDLMMNVSEMLVKHGCDPAMIELEITESMLLGNADKVNQTLHQLSAMGIKLALDDFGTGYSNLAYLQKYPLDILKIDRAFLGDQTRSMLMGTILDMGRVLGLKVVAEGVETKAQVNWLVENGCDQMQGFYYSQPLPVAGITDYLISYCTPDALKHKAA